MTTPDLKQRLASRDIVVAPGIFDAFGARFVERAGFPAAYLSGASIAYTRFGVPDIGLVDMGEVAATLSAITDRVDVPIIVDADTGFGNALNVQRTVRAFERAGAHAIQLEDQSLPKRCGHLSGKSLVPASEMVGKVKAALDARQDDTTLIIARTDAIAVEGFEQALDRAELYADAGADILFVEAPSSAEDMKTIIRRFGSRIPLLANMVEGGRTPMHTASELEELGYAIVIFPGGLVRAFAHMAEEYFSSLREHGGTDPFRDRMLDITQLNALLGTDEYLRHGARYDATIKEAGND